MRIQITTRYVAKFVNGTWVIFDRVLFENVQTCRSYKQAMSLLITATGN